jgi:hypothetical protein
MDPRYRQMAELIYPDHKAALNLIFERGNMSEKMWANTLLAEKVATKFGLNVTWYAKLHESTSLFQKYSTGYWLQLYLYKDL